VYRYRYRYIPLSIHIAIHLSVHRCRVYPHLAIYPSYRVRVRLLLRVRVNPSRCNRSRRGAAGSAGGVALIHRIYLSYLSVYLSVRPIYRIYPSLDDDKFTHTKHLNIPSPPQQPARSGAHRNGDTTTIKKGA